MSARGSRIIYPNASSSLADRRRHINLIQSDPDTEARHGQLCRSSLRLVHRPAAKTGVPAQALRSLKAKASRGTTSDL